MEGITTNVGSIVYSRLSVWGMMRLNVEELMMVPSDMIGLHTSTSLPHTYVSLI